MIRIRVEVLSTSPIVVRAEVVPQRSWDGLPRSSQGNPGFVGLSIMGWLEQYSNSVKRAADGLVP